MYLETKLKHTISVTGVGGQNEFGENAAGSTTTGVECFIDGTSRRYAGKDGNLVTLDYVVFFYPTADIGIDYTLSDGKDKDGVVILESGKIIGIEDSNHPRKGRVVRVALVKRN